MVRSLRKSARLLDQSKQNKKVKKPAKQQKKVNKSAKKSELSRANRVKCTKCSKTFSKKSNLTTHFNKNHLGLRWECLECKELQVSKHSHIRHMETVHGKRNFNKKDADKSQFMLKPMVEMTHKAKNALLLESTNILQ